MATSEPKGRYDRYKEFVVKNPTVATEIETGLRWLSYFTAGRFSQSSVISELIFSSSNLLKLLNDRILRQAHNLDQNTNQNAEKLRICLSIVEYLEVFAEFAARQKGDVTKWVVIVLIQVIKAGLRLMMLLKHNLGIQTRPAILPMNREQELKKIVGAEGEGDARPEAAVTLQRSGRVLRTLDAAPPLNKRNWKLPEKDQGTTPKKVTINFPPNPLQGERLAAEIMHIMRPLAHLACLRIYTRRSWKPWCLAVGLDLLSLQLSGDRKLLTPAERSELSRRALLLLLYLFRSPFYEWYCRILVLTLLEILEDSVPFTRFIVRPLIDYIPQWQKTYFYMWSS